MDGREPVGLNFIGLLRRQAPCLLRRQEIEGDDRQVIEGDGGLEILKG